MSCRLKKTDFTYLWWAYGWRGKSPEGRRILCMQSGNYGLAFDVYSASLKHLGGFLKPKSAEEAMSEDNEAIFSLPTADLRWKITKDRHHFTCTSSTHEIYSKDILESLRLPQTLITDSPTEGKTRWIESGRFVQRFDMQDLIFEDETGEILDVKARVEVTALPEYISICLNATPQKPIVRGSFTFRLNIDTMWNNVEQFIGEDGSNTVSISNSNGLGFLIQFPDLGNRGTVSINQDQSSLFFETLEKPWEEGQLQSIAFIIYPCKQYDIQSIMPLIKRSQVVQVQAEGIAPYNEKLSVKYDQVRGWYHVELPDISSWWDMEGNRDLLERVKLSLQNTGKFTKRIPLLFAKDESFPGMTGIMPMIRDLEGYPTGLPVQISKNWHSTKGMTYLYQGPWFHGFTIIELQPGESLECELTIAYAQWGGVPTASHAQLCLIGYALNQLWDQAAIGSFGESICYDPDINLGRSMIDDLRPLMVTPMGGHENTSLKWTWTDNVGGGDFLVYFNQKKEKQYLSRMKTYYKTYGPNLTEVYYAGITEDESITAKICVSTPRCDDINRAFHRIRYDVIKDTQFTRLAFYQLGADGYNNHQFNKMAIGDKEGLIKEWEPGKGELVYEYQGIPCKGKQPWFSAHEAVPGLYYNGEVPATGAWANRGMIIRNYKARLGGADMNIPYASVYFTKDQVKSSNIEISPPSELTLLKAGDFVEAEVELVVLPMDAKDYYGPNQGLINSLKKEANTWKPVYRQACGNNLKVKVAQGEVISEYPIVIAVDGYGQADFEISGGISYVPITFIGLKDYRGWQFKIWKEGEWMLFNQSIHGNDFWQTVYEPDSGEWSITFNVLLDSECTGTLIPRYWFGVNNGST